MPSQYIIILFRFYGKAITDHNFKHRKIIKSIYVLQLHPAGDVLWVFVEPGNVVP